MAYDEETAKVVRENDRLLGHITMLQTLSTSQLEEIRALKAEIERLHAVLQSSFDGRERALNHIEDLMKRLYAPEIK